MMYYCVKTQCISKGKMMALWFGINGSQYMVFLLSPRLSSINSIYTRLRNRSIMGLNIQLKKGRATSIGRTVGRSVVAGSRPSLPSRVLPLCNLFWFSYLLSFNLLSFTMVLCSSLRVCLYNIRYSYNI